jgi:hypothetical protein
VAQARGQPGHGTSGRGVEILPGRHEPILTDEQFRDALIGVNNRRHSTGPKLPPTGRTYLFRGLVYCECGARMRGANAFPADSNKVVEFSKYRRIASSLPDAIANATPEEVQELLPAIVERVDVTRPGNPVVMRVLRHFQAGAASDVPFGPVRFCHPVPSTLTVTMSSPSSPLYQSCTDWIMKAILVPSGENTGFQSPVPP